MGKASKSEGDTVAGGVLWRVIEVLGTEVLAFGTFVLLARLLVPDDFGLVAQASLLILTLQLIIQHGFPEALVQMEEAGDVHFGTAFWANLGIGIAAAVALMIAAPFAGAILDEQAFASVLIALAPTIVLLSANRIYLAKFRRERRFRDFMITNVLATGAGALTATIMAINGYELWSLVAQQWFYALVGLIVGYVRTGWLPGLYFEKHSLRAMAPFSSFTVLEALSAFCARRLDLLILALFWSAHEIGFYFLANRLLFSAGLVTYYTISHLGLPFLARLVGDQAGYKEAIYRTMRLLSLACLPALMGLMLVAPTMIPLLFGEDWAPSVRPFQALAAFSIFYAMALMCGQILIAAGEAMEAMILSGVTMIIFLAAITLAAPYGISYAAAAGGLANLLVVPAYLYRLRCRFGIDLKRVLSEQRPYWIATASMVAVVLYADSWMVAHLEPILHLLAASFAGAATYLFVMVLLARNDLLELYASLPISGKNDRHAPA